jgi:hypothetical protein
MRTGLHYLGYRFADPSGRGEAQGPPISSDIAWTVKIGDSVVASGSGSARGVGQFGSTTGIGVFQGVARREYTVTVSPGPGFAPFLTGAPVLEVGMVTETPGAALGALNMIFDLSLKIFGVILVMMGAMILLLALRNRRIGQYSA